MHRNVSSYRRSSVWQNEGWSSRNCYRSHSHIPDELTELPSKHVLTADKVLHSAASTTLPLFSRITVMGNNREMKRVRNCRRIIVEVQNSLTSLTSTKFPSKLLLLSVRVPPYATTMPNWQMLSCIIIIRGRNVMRRNDVRQTNVCAIGSSSSSVAYFYSPERYSD